MVAIPIPIHTPDAPDGPVSDLCFYHLRVSRIGYAVVHRVDQPNLPVYFPQKQGACVSGQSTTIETTNHVPASKPLELHNVRGTLCQR